MSEPVKDYPPYLDYPKPRKKQTNADKIRQMTDEELARYLIVDVEAEAIRRAGRYLTQGEIEQAVRDCTDWLKKEVSDNG